jgi:hypothetical protein
MHECCCEGSMNHRTHDRTIQYAGFFTCRKREKRVTEMFKDRTIKQLANLGQYRYDCQMKADKIHRRSGYRFSGLIPTTAHFFLKGRERWVCGWVGVPEGGSWISRQSIRVSLGKIKLITTHFLTLNHNPITILLSKDLQARVLCPFCRFL